MTPTPRPRDRQRHRVAVAVLARAWHSLGAPCTRIAALAILASTLPVLVVHAQPRTELPSLQGAFSQGEAMGRAGNATARGRINSATAQGTVPAYNTQPPQSGYFGGSGLTAEAAAATQACAAAGNGSTVDAQACRAVNFSQTNPASRPSFSIAPNDPLLTRARSITADPQSIAGSIAGTYSGCSVQTTTTPDRFETALCHQYRSTETLTCDKVLTVTAEEIPGCADGEFLTRVTADPCPTCRDTLAFDFSCAEGAYRMDVFTMDRATGEVFMELGSQIVPGALDTEIPKTPGPSRNDRFHCYETYYSQSCRGGYCSIGAWFANPCQGTSFEGVSIFAMPTTVSFTDAWDNQCSALEARER